MYHLRIKKRLTFFLFLFLSISLLGFGFENQARAFGGGYGDGDGDDDDCDLYKHGGIQCTRNEDCWVNDCPECVVCNPKTWKCEVDDNFCQDLTDGELDSNSNECRVGICDPDDDDDYGYVRKRRHDDEKLETGCKYSNPPLDGTHEEFSPLCFTCGEKGDGVCDPGVGENCHTARIDCLEEEASIPKVSGRPIEDECVRDEQGNLDQDALDRQCLVVHEKGGKKSHYDPYKGDWNRHKKIAKCTDGDRSTKERCIQDKHDRFNIICEVKPVECSQDDRDFVCPIGCFGPKVPKKKDDEKDWHDDPRCKLGLLDKMLCHDGYECHENGYGFWQCHDYCYTDHYGKEKCIPAHHQAKERTCNGLSGEEYEWCDKDCWPERKCGNGFVEEGEDCDPGMNGPYSGITDEGELIPHSHCIQPGETKECTVIPGKDKPRDDDDDDGEGGEDDDGEPDGVTVPPDNPFIEEPVEGGAVADSPAEGTSLGIQSDSCSLSRNAATNSAAGILMILGIGLVGLLTKRSLTKMNR